ncbi:MAG: CBS domain-containing protein, partial [Gemmatimonadetes bacterium]|nr:CBS domain-containing protein [Gemmatimonadota bacterium]
RPEIVWLRADLPVREARAEARGSGFSKLPVSQGGPEETRGIVTALDLLLAPDDKTVGELVRPVDWVPEVKPALALLQEFRRTGRRVAFVADEHGDLSGLVTLTDLLEEISGEMIEGGDLHKVLYRRLGPRRIVIPGRMEIRFFNEEFGTDLDSEEVETMAGLVLELTGRIPESGETFEVDGVRLVVAKVEPARIVTLDVTLPDPAAPTGETK